MFEFHDPALTPESSVAEKCAWLTNRYIKLDRDVALEEQIAGLFKMGDDDARTAEPMIDSLTGETRGMMVVGNSGSGKSALLRRTLRSSGVLSIAGRETEGNTLYLTVPPEATIKALATSIAEATGYPKVSSRAKSYETWSIARHRLGERGIGLLVIDEAHHLMRRGSGKDVEGAIQTMKSLLQGEHPVAVIIAGVQKLPDAIMEDPETDSRFPKFELPRLLEGSKDAASFARGIQTCARALGLQMPEDGTLTDRILFAEAGSMGRSVRLAKNIMMNVLMDGRSQIRLQDAHRAFAMRYGSFPQSPFDAYEWLALRQDLIDGGWSR
ncbi:TniB family NTP-binding protein [Sagittula sp. SSi028]|uniref:TniB family NTP-binding protein n=1 Tax=Sagittula sp. SSi028 TaxID=3400636 RepID=UPI003AF586CF